MGMEWESLVGRGRAGVKDHESGTAPSMTPAWSPLCPHGAQCKEGHSVSLTASLTSSSSATGEPAADGGGGKV